MGGTDVAEADGGTELAEDNVAFRLCSTQLLPKVARW